MIDYNKESKYRKSEIFKQTSCKNKIGKNPEIVIGLHGNTNKVWLKCDSDRITR